MAVTQLPIMKASSYFVEDITPESKTNHFSKKMWRICRTHCGEGGCLHGSGAITQRRVWQNVRGDALNIIRGVHTGSKV